MINHEKVFFAIFSFIAVSFLVACQPAADKASSNLSRAADNFEIARKIAFYDQIQGENVLEVVGMCSIGNDNTDYQISVTCKQPDGSFVKHKMIRGDNMALVSQQLEGENVSTFHSRVYWRPQAIIPDIDLQGSIEELTTDTN